MRSTSVHASGSDGCVGRKPATIDWSILSSSSYTSNRLARKSTKALTLAGTSLEVMTACTGIGGKLQSSSTRQPAPATTAGRGMEVASTTMPDPCSPDFNVIEDLL